MTPDDLLAFTATATDEPPRAVRIIGYIAVIDVLGMDAPEVRVFSPGGDLLLYGNSRTGGDALQLAGYVVYADGGVRSAGVRCLL